MQCLMVRQTDQLAHPIPGHEHGHDKVDSLHFFDAILPMREHQEVDPLGQRAARVRVADVAEGGEPGVKGRVGVAVDQRVGHHRGQDGVGLFGTMQGQGVEVTAEQFDVGVGLLDVVEGFSALNEAIKGVVVVGVVCVRDQMSGEDVDGQAFPSHSGLGHAFGNEDLAVEVPKAAPVGKRSELDHLDRVSTENGQTGASDG